ncbi:pentatricopeptide repeat-containing protein 2, mitochondrial-like isoform X2 [Mytilus californianus]|uniref:pentatricopeptide repeat-containing protein 2, mitochondrial-like isoform X2 n=1 Tax=Mytilus californianus TaxID=6549 RepID=UPI0022468050|nr:pentatricopeptide repeat-containing protein 2, mitochondrial-like isoform X2 [Mytilus californianus]
MRIILKLFKTFHHNTLIQNRRYLLGDGALRIQSYLSHCQDYQSNYDDARRETFMAEMKDKLTTGDVVLKDELKTMIHLVKTDEDVNMCIQMAKQFQKVKYQLQQRYDFFFGPVFMRMLHHSKKADIAFMLMEDRKGLRNLLFHLTAVVIYMDLLFEAGKYEQVVKCYEELDRAQKYKHLPLRNHMTLALAALYKMNSPQALEKATNLVQVTYHNSKRITSPRTRAYAAALALNQIIALSRLDQVDAAMELLDKYHVQTSISYDNPSKIFPDCIEALSKMVDRNDDPQIKQTFTDTKTDLKQAQLVNDVSIFDKLCDTIHNSRPDNEHIQNLQDKRGRLVRDHHRY